MQDLSGKHLGNYTIIEAIGEGGMGQVYRAHQASVERDVALKVLPDHLTNDATFLRRFQQEAKVIANLQHPHILSVHDFGEEDGVTYLVMPLMSGGTLTDLIQAKSITMKDVRRIMTQVGSALVYAHERGLIHRDIKPGNILIDDTGNCQLSDFGLVKELEGDSQLTESGAIIGTPTYMSPEQGMGKVLDRRADIYSLGVILYELVTGEVPFTGDSPVGVVVKHIHDPLPAPQTVNPALSDSLVTVVEKTLSKEPDDRYATAGDFVGAIQDAIPESGVMPAVPVQATTTERVMDDVPTTIESLPETQAMQRGNQERNRMILAVSILAIAIVLLGIVLVGTLLNREDDTIPDVAAGLVKRVCYNAATGVVEPGTFDGDIWSGVQDAAAKLSLEADFRVIPDSAFEEGASVIDAAYRTNMDELLESDCDLIVASGFSVFSTIAEIARENPDANFVYLDGEFDPPLDNVWAQIYATDEGAFMAGYAAAGISQTGKVATYGGSQFPSIESFMDGFARGVAHYNEEHDAEIEVLGWDIETREGRFIDSFGPPEAGQPIAEEFIEDGADVILPISGFAAIGTADVAQQHDNVYIIGTDSDWTITNPDYADITLTSIEKRWNISVLSALDAMNKGEFEGGTHLGTVATGDLGLSPFYGFDAVISEDVAGGLKNVETGIITGRIQTRPSAEG